MDELDGGRSGPGVLPRLAIAMGDPAGIGPEIVIKALAEPEIYRACTPVVIGDAGTLSRAPGWAGGEPRLRRIAHVEEAAPEPGVIDLIDLGNVPPSVGTGQASPEGGRATIEYLVEGMRLGMAGQIGALVFGPLNKEAMKMAGSRHADEYGLLAEMSGVEEYGVVNVSPRMILASVSLHVPMRQVADLVTRDRVLAAIRHGYRAALAAGIENPRVGVAALNPHAGEHGTIGTEEQEHIGPAVEAALAEGIDASGPFPADTFFMTAQESRYDVYVGMYHDQGRIALKLLEFGNVTTMGEGLPAIVCTVGHGTAYDIAGKGVARHHNMRETILLAARRAAARDLDSGAPAR
jgi:4-hydroxythreonine-4-phosphate dehydrogenase